AGIRAGAGARAGRFEDAVHLAQGGGGVGDVGEGEDQQRGVDARVVDGDGGDVAATQVHVLVTAQALGGGFERGGRDVDADDSADEGGEAVDDLAGAAAQVRDDGARREEGERGDVGEIAAVEFGAQAVPLA